MIQDSLKNKKHVWHYDTNIVPNESEIEDIVRESYKFGQSKQKSFAYEIFVLGPDSERSQRLMNLCDGNRIRVDIDAYGNKGENTKRNIKKRINDGLAHLLTAPWTLLITPRLTEPNPYIAKLWKESDSHWQHLDPAFCKRNRGTAIEVGLLVNTITGITLDKGLDISNTLCVPKEIEDMEDFPYLTFTPMLIVTIGKAKKYYYERLTEEEALEYTKPEFEEIFKFIDR